MLTSRSALVLATVALAAWSSVAEAQVVGRAPRGFRGIFGTRQPTDPSRTQQELMLVFNATGGVDDNVGAGETVGPPVVGADSGQGATTQTDLSLAYRRGTQAHTFGLAGWGSFSNYYGDTTLPNSRGAGVGLTGQTELTRRWSVGGGARLDYLSQLPISTGAFGVGQTADSVPPAAGLTGLYDRGSWSTSLDGNVDRRWSRRASTQLAYSFVTTEFLDNSDGDLRSHQVTATHRHQYSRDSSFDLAYDYIETRVGISQGGDPGRPTSEHRPYGGVTISRRLSATRTLDIVLHGGALYVDAVAGNNESYQLWTPFVQTSVRAGVFGQWAVEAHYERSTQSIPGLPRPETYVTDIVTTSFGGVIGRRMDLVFSGAYATGDVGVEQSRSEYVTSGASAQFRMSILRNLAAVVGYSYYRYTFTDTLLPIGLPSDFDRNAFRAGLTFSLPIIGGERH